MRLSHRIDLTQQLYERLMDTEQFGMASVVQLSLEELKEQARAELVKSEQNVVSIRLAVAIADGDEGRFVGCVYCDDYDDDNAAMESARDDTLDRNIIAQAFIRVDVPMIQTVAARVVNAGE